MKAKTTQLINDDAVQADKAKQAATPMDERTKLMDELSEAYKANDWKLIASKASELSKYQAKLETLELADKQTKLAGISMKLKAIIDGALADELNKLEADELKLIDGVWYEHSFTDTSSSFRLTAKQAATRKPSATGYGKRFSESTEALLEAHGSELMPNSELSWKQAYDKAKLVDTEKASSNASYAIRAKLTKLFGTAIN